ncbi:MAG TPA: TrbG/VirB9 family P-type conjugative transfer protein [Candidatus Angelobacter sp.]|nr:TrbG/VirB9 family P-type conjugative transfer protein [Candidatus Angelobacter sp.]
MLRTLRTIFLALTIILPLAAFAQEVKDARTVKYQQKSIVLINARPRFTTLILLPQQERILDYVIGDRDEWVLEGAQNFAYLKPSKAGIETSINLITASGNIYSFYCVASDGAPDLKVFIEPSDQSMISALQGAPRLVPASEVEDIRQAAALQVKNADAEKDAFRNHYPTDALKSDYKFQKDKKPFKVSDIYHDDKFTYIRSSAQEKPTLYEVKDGQPTLINFSLNNGVYVVEHIVDKGYLQVGKHRMDFERQGN